MQRNTSWCTYSSRFRVRAECLGCPLSGRSWVRQPSRAPSSASDPAKLFRRRQLLENNAGSSTLVAFFHRDLSCGQDARVMDHDQHNTQLRWCDWVKGSHCDSSGVPSSHLWYGACKLKLQERTARRAAGTFAEAPRFDYALLISINMHISARRP